MTEKLSRKTRLQKALKIPDPELVYTTVEMQSVKQQITKPRRNGESCVIICPYCLQKNVEDMPLCCDQLRRALELIFAPVYPENDQVMN